MLEIPLSYYEGRNHPDVLKLGSPAEVGKRLMDYMAERIGHQDLREVDILDFGCGSRFSESIVNLGVAVRTYTGVDTYRELVELIDRQVQDPKLVYHVVSYRNNAYNKDGEPITEETRLPVAGRTYELVCMFSVITHQDPQEAKAIFGLLRHHIRPSGKLFFTVPIEEGIDGFEEKDPSNPGALTQYHPELLKSILESTGWHWRDTEPRGVRGLPMMDSVVCTPI